MKPLGIIARCKLDHLFSCDEARGRLNYDSWNEVSEANVSFLVVVGPYHVGQAELRVLGRGQEGDARLPPAGLTVLLPGIGTFTSLQCAAEARN